MTRITAQSATTDHHVALPETTNASRGRSASRRTTLARIAAAITLLGAGLALHAPAEAKGTLQACKREVGTCDMNCVAVVDAQIKQSCFRRCTAGYKICVGNLGPGNGKASTSKSPINPTGGDVTARPGTKKAQPEAPPAGRGRITLPRAAGAR